MASVETSAPCPVVLESIETARGDIQGNILRAYGFPFARYEILRIVDAARRAAAADGACSSSG